MKKLRLIYMLLAVAFVIAVFAFGQGPKSPRRIAEFVKSPDIVKLRGATARQLVGTQVDLEGFYYDGSIPMVIDDINRVFVDMMLPEDSYVPIVGTLPKGAKSGDRIRIKKAKLDRPSAADSAHVRRESTVLRLGSDATVSTVQLSTMLVVAQPIAVRIVPGTILIPRNYAVLIAGGGNPASNHQRYFNDLKTMYAILRNKGYSDANIFVLYADGVSRDAAVLPVDYPADLPSIQTVFNTLATKMSSLDTLYIMTNDHGGTGGTLALWYSSISASAFGNEVNKIKSYDKMIAQMKQCYSGAMIPALTGARRTVMSSCSATTSSYGRVANDFGEFTFWYFAALTGTKPDGSGAVNADANGDGKISITEAYNFARANDTAPETPYFEDDGVAPAHSGAMPNAGDGTRSLSIFL